MPFKDFYHPMLVTLNVFHWTDKIWKYWILKDFYTEIFIKFFDNIKFYSYTCRYLIYLMGDPMPL